MAQDSREVAGKRKVIKMLAVDACPLAMTKIIALIDSSDDRIALEAAKTVLDRAIGRPTQALEISGENGGPLQLQAISSLSDEELARAASRVLSSQSHTMMLGGRSDE